MAKLNVPPTKTTSLDMKRSLQFASEGFDLLDEKRQILVLELMSRVEAARRAQADVDERMAVAFDAMQRAVLQRGLAAMETESAGISVRHDVRLDSHRVVGMTSRPSRSRARSRVCNLGWRGRPAPATT